MERKREEQRKQERREEERKGERQKKSKGQYERGEEDEFCSVASSLFLIGSWCERLWSVVIVSSALLCVCVCVCVCVPSGICM